ALSVRAYYEDTDAGGVVYHAAYIRFFERARTETMRRLGFCHQRLREEWGVQFVVRALSADYFRPAHLDDILRVDARFAGRGRTYADFAQTAALPSGETAAAAKVRVVCVSQTSWRAAALPPLLAGKIDSYAG
ncbi:MAG: YbgC/FadM family acyl-CoA thioesterase, partial [Betaproteobacteria bacterium]|nr:YbgC/FadM family acyl-CoA thioesterase [Betaproteobacteria bacterium]